MKRTRILLALLALTTLVLVAACAREPQNVVQVTPPAPEQQVRTVIPPPPAQQWVPGQWVQQGPNLVWRPGYWQY